MRRIRTRTLAGLGVLVVAAAAGGAVAWRLSPTRLRPELEALLTRVMKAPVTIGSVELSLSPRILLVGRDVRVGADPAGAGLHVDRVTASLRPLALTTGPPYLRQLDLEGATLRWIRGPDGAFERFGGGPAESAEALAPGERSHPDEMLAPLVTLEGFLRVLLAKPYGADTVWVRDSQIVFVDRGHGAASGGATLTLTGAEGRLRHERLRGEAQVRLQGILRDADGERGALAWEGSRDRNGAIRVAMTSTDFDLAALGPWLRAQGDAHLEGPVSGVVSFESDAVGHGAFDVDLVGRGLRTAITPISSIDAPVMATRRVAARGTLRISPEQVSISGGRVVGSEVDLRLDAVVARPLRDSSTAEVNIEFRDVEVDQVRHAIGWLPEVEREEAARIVAPIESGRLLSLRAGGTATLSAWQAFLAGRTRIHPRNFVLDAVLADTVIRVAEDDWIEDLSGRLWWSDDRVEVRDASARLNGSPLPHLDVTLIGVTNFFAGDPAKRQLRSGSVPLDGLQALWRVLQSDQETSGVQTRIELEIDTLHHAMFLWPIEDLRADLEPIPGGLRISTERARYAGVPIQVEGEWQFEPDQRVRMRIEAVSPDASDPAGSDSDGWARGRIRVGALHEGRWRQKWASAEFRAVDGAFELYDVDIDLHPTGRVTGSAHLDLSLADTVPYRVDFAMRGGDVSTLASQAGLPESVATGRANLAGSLEGALTPGVSPLADLIGSVSIEASDGLMRRTIPPVVAVALASESFNPFTSRETVRFDSVETQLEFADGRMRTESFSMDGPDLRVFASGEIDLLDAAHEIDAEVGLFLFRQIDSVVEKIPILNLLLMGTSESLIAAYFELSGPWDDPEAKLIPLRSMASSPASLVFQSIPMIMVRGIQAIGAMLAPDEKTEAAPVEVAPPAATSGS